MNAGAVVAASVVGIFLLAGLVAMVVAALGSMRDLEEKTFEAADNAKKAASNAEEAAGNAEEALDAAAVAARAAIVATSELQIGQNATIRKEESKGSNRRNSRRSRRRALRK